MTVRGKLQHFDSGYYLLICMETKPFTQTATGYRLFLLTVTSL